MYEEIKQDMKIVMNVFDNHDSLYNSYETRQCIRKQTNVGSDEIIILYQCSNYSEYIQDDINMAYCDLLEKRIGAEPLEILSLYKPTECPRFNNKLRDELCIYSRIMRILCDINGHPDPSIETVKMYMCEIKNIFKTTC